MPRTIYALVIDCTDTTDVVEQALAKAADLINNQPWETVRSVTVQMDVPMATDERRQDPERTSAEIRLVDVG